MFVFREGEGKGAVELGVWLGERVYLKWKEP